MTDAARSSMCGTVLLIDALRCNVGHAIFVGMVGLIWLVPLVGGAIAVSAIVLGVFPSVRIDL